MAVEQALGIRLTDREAEALIAELEALRQRGDGPDDDLLAVAVRKLGPRGPQAGAAAQPEQPF